MGDGLRMKVVKAAIIGAELLVATASLAAESRKYDPGASDTEIKIGQTVTYSGPLSAGSVIGKVEAAYFKMINDRGGIHGRKISLISYDDAGTPSKTVEQVRKLVEGDEVLFTFQTFGNASNMAVQKYLNDRKIPQLFVAGRAMQFEDPATFPWTMGFAPNLRTEIRVYARFIRDNYPNARIGLLYQNDETGKDYIAGLKQALGARASGMLVSEAPYDATDPTVDSQVVRLKAAGIDVLVDMAAARFAAPRLETRSPARRQLVLDRRSSGACGSGEREGAHLGKFVQGGWRSDLDRRHRHEEMGRIHG